MSFWNDIILSAISAQLHFFNCYFVIVILPTVILHIIILATVIIVILLVTIILNVMAPTSSTLMLFRIIMNFKINLTFTQDYKTAHVFVIQM